jgi:hypothetical protein
MRMLSISLILWVLPSTSLTVANEQVVRRALEQAGVEFIDENGGGAGVRLRKPRT